MIYFMLSWVDHEKSFITLGPGCAIITNYVVLKFRPNWQQYLQEGTMKTLIYFGLEYNN